MEQTVNTFLKGLQTDTHPMVSGNDVLTDCLNGTFITLNGNEVVLQNDMGNRKIDEAYLPAGYTPVGIKEYGGIIYIASYNPITGKSQIGSFPSPLQKVNLNQENPASFDFADLAEYFIYKDFKFIKSTSKLVVLSETPLTNGDKFVLYSRSIWSNNFGETYLEDFKGNSQKLFKLSFGVLDNKSLFLDLTKTLIYWNKSGQLSNASNGYFIAGSKNASLENLTIDDEEFIKNRLALPLDTFISKISGIPIIKMELNTIYEFTPQITIKLLDEFNNSSNNTYVNISVTSDIKYNGPEAVGERQLVPIKQPFKAKIRTTDIPDTLSGEELDGDIIIVTSNETDTLGLFICNNPKVYRYRLNRWLRYPYSSEQTAEIIDYISIKNAVFSGESDLDSKIVNGLLPSDWTITTDKIILPHEYVDNQSIVFDNTLHYYVYNNPMHLWIGDDIDLNKIFKVENDYYKLYPAGDKVKWIKLPRPSFNTRFDRGNGIEEQGTWIVESSQSRKIRVKQTPTDYYDFYYKSSSGNWISDPLSPETCTINERGDGYINYTNVFKIPISNIGDTLEYALLPKVNSTLKTAINNNDLGTLYLKDLSVFDEVSVKEIDTAGCSIKGWMYRYNDTELLIKLKFLSYLNEGEIRNKVRLTPYFIDSQNTIRYIDSEGNIANTINELNQPITAENAAYYEFDVANLNGVQIFTVPTEMLNGHNIYQWAFEVSYYSSISGWQTISNSQSLWVILSPLFNSWYDEGEMVNWPLIYSNISSNSVYANKMKELLTIPFTLDLDSTREISNDTESSGNVNLYSTTYNNNNIIYLLEHTITYTTKYNPTITFNNNLYPGISISDNSAKYATEYDNNQPNLIVGEIKPNIHGDIPLESELENVTISTNVKIVEGEDPQTGLLYTNITSNIEFEEKFKVYEILSTRLNSTSKTVSKLTSYKQFLLNQVDNLTEGQLGCCLYENYAICGTNTEFVNPKISDLNSTILSKVKAYVYTLNGYHENWKNFAGYDKLLGTPSYGVELYVYRLFEGDSGVTNLGILSDKVSNSLNNNIFVVGIDTAVNNNLKFIDKYIVGIDSSAHGWVEKLSNSTPDNPNFIMTVWLRTSTSGLALFFMKGFTTYPTLASVKNSIKNFIQGGNEIIVGKTLKYPDEDFYFNFSSSDNESIYFPDRNINYTYYNSNDTIKVRKTINANYNGITINLNNGDFVKFSKSTGTISAIDEYTFSFKTSPEFSREINQFDFEEIEAVYINNNGTIIAKATNNELLSKDSIYRLINDGTELEFINSTLSNNIGNYRIPILNSVVKKGDESKYETKITYLNFPSDPGRVSKYYRTVTPSLPVVIYLHPNDNNISVLDFSNAPHVCIWT